MTSPAEKINDLHSLQREKQRLQAYCLSSEKLMWDKVTFIKSNYPQIIAEEFLPFNKEKNIKVSNGLDWVNEFVLKKFLKMDTSGKNKIIASLVKIAEVGIIRLVNSFRKKK